MNYLRIIKIFICAVAVFGAFAASANPYNDQLSSMSEQQRHLVFAAYIAKSGERCSSVTKTFYQGSDKKGDAFWNAACAKGDSFVIQVNNAGSTRILDCNVIKTINRGTCFTKFKR